MNPLLHTYTTKFGTVPFNEIKEEHFLPALKEAINQAKGEIESITSNKEVPSFTNTIEALERSGELVSKVAEVFFNLNSAETNKNIQKIAQELSPLLSQYGNDIMLNAELFEKINSVYKSQDRERLTEEESMLLDKSYRSFVRNGAGLGDDDKARLRELDMELATLSLKFGENVLAETNAFELIIEDEKELIGLPENVIEEAKALAKNKGLDEQWIFTLQFPSYIPFVTYAQNRELRKKMVLAYGSRAFKGDELDNQEIVKRIAKFRLERANLLGFDTHAHYVLDERMAKSPDKVRSFLNEILEYAKPAGHAEVEELVAFAQKLDGLDQIEKWDFAYYSEKLKQQKYQVDDEMLKPFFKLENVINGAFGVAQRLYGISFEERGDIQKYHEDVITYEVKDTNGEHLAIFYADFFPRQGKRNGAWMTSFRSQKKVSGVDIRPHISIVCNFTKPTETKPSLLTFNEVTTLFHEFGHALHGILADGIYASLSGTSVYWDFVELPSQVMENWCFEKECLDLFAEHFETGEKIPNELVERLRASSTFMEGYATVRQIGLGRLDMAWHAKDISKVTGVGDYEKEVLEETELLPWVNTSSTSSSFSHIFQGGYSSGYYSYKWAEVLDADAFEFFKEEGIFNKEVGAKFKKLLSSGGSKHPMDLYMEFRGKEPDSKALLRRAGLLKE